MPENRGFDNITVSISDIEVKDDAKVVADFDKLSMDDQEAFRFGQDTKHRAILVWWMIITVSVWLVFVLLITALGNTFNLRISDNVLITLLATTTVNVLGLANIILTGLFGSKRRWRKTNSSQK